MARPTVMTPEVIAKLEEAFKYGATDIEACGYADIAIDTLYLYQRKNPQFINRKETLKNSPIFTAKKSVVDRLPRDPDLALKYLERRAKAEFSLRSEITGKDGKDLPAPILGGSNVQANDSNNEATEAN